MVGAFVRFKAMEADAELARRLGVRSLDDLEVGFVEWARDFVRRGYG